MTHLLDTNTWAVYFRGKHAQLAARVNGHATADLGLSTIVLGELYYGAYHSGPGYVVKNLLEVEQLRQMYPHAPFDAAASNEYGLIREHLASTGQIIGPNDLLIAATARANNLTLVTHNTAEFSRVPGLKLEDWQVP